jgi:hypothetical protein
MFSNSGELFLKEHNDTLPTRKEIANSCEGREAGGSGNQNVDHGPVCTGALKCLTQRRKGAKKIRTNLTAENTEHTEKILTTDRHGYRASRSDNGK